MTKAIKRIYLAANLIFLLWLALSYVDIVAHNLTTFTYSKYNLLIILLGGIL